MALDEKAAKGVLERLLLALRRAAPDSQAQVTLSTGRWANTRFGRGEITSSGDVDDTTVSASVLLGKRKASAEVNQLDDAALSALAERVVRLAKLAPENPEAMPVLGAQKYLPEPSTYDAAAARLDAQVRAQAIANGLEDAQRSEVELSGFFSQSSVLWGLATSAGARVLRRATAVEMTATARTQDQTGSGWGGALSHRAADVQPERIVTRAIDKARRSAKPRRLEPGRYTVVLEPAAVAGLLDFLTGSLGLREAEEGRSYFSADGGKTRLGEQLFGKHITLVSDPTSAQTPGATADGEGLPLRPTTWIDQGKLTTLSCSRYWAQKTGQKPTGGHATFCLKPGTAAFDELTKGVKRGLWVTRFWYLRWVDPQSLLATGLTRDGVFLIENGEVVGPVGNFRFNESPLAMLKNADALSSELFRPPGDNLWVPALRTHDFHFTSTSEAV